MFGLQYFDLSELWSPYALTFTIAVAVVFMLYTGPWRTRIPNSAQVSSGKKATFLIGLFLLYFALEGPVGLLAHLTFTFHMVSMGLAFIVAPPLLLLGLPAWLIQYLFRWDGFKRLGFLLNPILCLVMFNGFFSLYHLPQVHDYIMVNFALHRAYFVLLFITAMLMFWHIVGPVPHLNRLNGLKKLGYIFATSMLLTPSCALIIFANSPLFSVYSDPTVWAQAIGYCIPKGNVQFLLDSVNGPTFFSLFSPLEDQQLGGIIMKLTQEFVNAALLARVFVHWYRLENHADDLNPLQHRTV